MVSTKKRLQNLNYAVRAFPVICLLVSFYVDRVAQADDTPPPKRVSLQLAPMKFAVKNGGDISYTRRYSKYADKQSSDQSAGVRYFYNIQVYSFIWQPWFARVNGGIGFDLDANRSSAGGYSSSKSTSLGGSVNASLNLIPKSRFPFEASIYRRNGRQKSGLTSSDFNSHSTSINVSQGYTSRNGETGAQLSYYYAENDSSIVSNLSKKDSLSFSMNHQIYTFQTVKFDASVIRDTRPRADYKSLVSTASTSYTYHPDPTVSALGTLNVYRSDYRQYGIENNALSEQFNAIGSWRPNDSSLTITSGARLYRFTNNSPLANNSTYQKNTLASIMFGATYSLSKGVRASGSVGIEDALGRQVVTTLASLTSTKSFTEITNIAGFTYKRFISGSLTNQSSSSTNSPELSRNTQGVALSLGHSLTKSSAFYGGGLVSNINQVVTSGVSSNLTAPNTRLATNASMVWVGVEPTRRSQTAVRITGSDSRNMTDSNVRPATQIFNAQMTRNEGLTRNQTLVGNLTFQLFRQAASVSTPSNRTININGGLTYQHNRVFNIRQLTFQSTLKAGNNRLANGQNESTTSWENNLMYVIGKLQLKLDARTAATNQVHQSWIVFAMKRQF